MPGRERGRGGEGEGRDEGKLEHVWRGLPGWEREEKSHESWQSTDVWSV
jgi:hypothetical protein